MAPSQLQLSAQIRQLIFYHLDNDLIENALFFAGRLHGLDNRGPEAIYLLALCHKKLGQFKTASDYARPPALRGNHLGCAYVFAQCCFALEKHSDGIAALERSRPLWDGKTDWNQRSETSRRHLPDAAAVYCLLGKLLQANRDVKRAAECYVDALKLNPFMWDAFERLCDTGIHIRPSSVFKLTPELAALLTTSNQNNTHSSLESLRTGAGGLQSLQLNGKMPVNHADIDPFAPSSKGLGEPINPPGYPHGLPRPQSLRPNFTLGANPSSAANIETPTAPIVQESIVVKREAGLADQPSSHHVEPPMAPMRRTKTVQPTIIDNQLDSSKSRLHSSRSRANVVSEDREASDFGSEDLPPTHKRSVSGSISQSSTAASSRGNDFMKRRSQRLFNQIRPSTSKQPGPTSTYPKDAPEPKRAKATGTKGKSLATSTMGRVVSGNRKPGDGIENIIRETKPQSSTAETRYPGQKQTGSETDPGRDLMPVQWLLDILGKLGQGYYSLTRYQCQLAIQSFTSVSPQQRDTPWVLAQIGKAYYEQNSYVEAEKTFARLRKISPLRVDDMEIYSTVLWHLKNDTELAFLSHELIDAERLSPEAWCTIGNSFSLQREHNSALKCFKRATQLDPKFAYGFTLQGHEHISNEEYDKAMEAYRKAISADNRHYNGWYGLGKVYEKLGNYEMAEKHYRAAAGINPSNPVLVCCIGVILERLKRPQAALAQYSHACDLQPSSTLSRYKKARTLLNLRRHQEALEELNVLKDLAPDESNVHYMLGRTHARMGNKAFAIKHYTIAMNLDPKAAPYLKEHMESLNDEDDENADEDDEDEEMT